MKKTLTLLSLLLLISTSTTFAGTQAYECCRCPDGTTQWNNNGNCGAACTGGIPEGSLTDQASCLAASCSSSTQSCAAKISSIGCN